jgi:GntR family transcriptional repressor for pyruvate dehydrogenase complex
VERPTIPTVTRSLTTLFQYERVTLADLLEARRTIEPACARVAGSRATAADVAALSRSVENMRAHLDEDGPFWSENANFHLVLVTAGHSIVLHTLMVALRELIYQFTAGLHISQDERAKTLADHAAITEAITAHDPEAAARAALAHLMTFEKRLQEHFPDFGAVCLSGSSASSHSN